MSCRFLWFYEEIQNIIYFFFTHIFIFSQCFHIKFTFYYVKHDSFILFKLVCKVLYYYAVSEFFIFFFSHFSKFFFFSCNKLSWKQKFAILSFQIMCLNCLFNRVITNYCVTLSRGGVFPFNFVLHLVRLNFNYSKAKDRWIPQRWLILRNAQSCPNLQHIFLSLRNQSDSANHKLSLLTKARVHL